MDTNEAIELSRQAISLTANAPLMTVTRTPAALLDEHTYYYKEAMFNALMAKTNMLGVMLYIHNETAKPLQLFNTSMTSLNVSECDIAPGEFLIFTNTLSRNFYLGPASPQSVEHLNRTLTYGTAKKKCRIETSFMIKSSFGYFSPTRTPTWKHNARSVGSQPLKCTSTLISKVTQEPYSYRLDIRIAE